MTQPIWGAGYKDLPTPNPQGFQLSKVAFPTVCECRLQSLEELSHVPLSQGSRTSPGSGSIKENTSESCIDITGSAAALRLTSELD